MSAAAEENTQLQGNKTLITMGAMFAGLMAFLDISIVNVALNDIRASFGTPLDQIAWVSTAYAMANITIIPLSGWLLKRFGFRRYYTASILIFTAASVLCGLSWDLPSLVVFRVLQGLGGGAIIPTSQSVLFSRYPERQHGMAGALFGMGAITGPLLGPSLGGYLIDLSSWHWIFLINVPFGLFSAWVAWKHLAQPGFVAERAPVDRFGIVLLAVGMVSLQYVLEEGNREGWFESATIAVLAVVAGISLVGFVSHELETRHPVVELRIFLNRAYAAATGLNFLIGTAIFAGSLLLSLYCGTVMHYRALDIGRVFLFGTWIQLLIFPLAGRLVTRVDPRLLLVVANVGIFTSLWLNAHLTAQADLSTLVTPLFIRAVGTGFGFVPLTFLAVTALPASQRPAGTALFSLTRELGASIGTAWMSTILDRESHRAYAAITQHVDAYDPWVQEQLAMLRAGPGSRLFAPDSAALAVLQHRISEQALVKAFNSGFLMLALTFLAASVLIVFMKKPGPSPAGPVGPAH
ncbi:DHA2 family efflux MFS transporter permease subunit [Corallococcus llansteffanensis]|uniref:DHA2 family efflux MFS transporter permease subunit n=1 Tax=Corallococcus llansteffanensis TaxID=2316731 RepID=A0A3A8Q1R1_9BACT|nr:DHA2 family efflux MFS transporter permease subunit [Corallococcus llansteffanensis]RKH62696.1 DHA2 family efflux MFS transporter permease subunit [Corallococcus llansteffanensis]